MIGSWRSPSFWWRDLRGMSAVLAAILTPIARTYGVIAAQRMRRAGFRASVPVLCIGNLVVGGAGKTPTALALAERLIAAGEKPWFLSRGYRSRAAHGPPLRVDRENHLAADVGDEPLLLARVAPTLVSADRVAAAKIAAEQGASVLILDDGLHNPALEKDLKLIVVDAAAGVGNGQCLPAGPLRAPLSEQLEFASGLVIFGEDARGETIAARARLMGKPILRAQLVLAPGQAAELKGRRVYAFAGIGRPEKFFLSLTEAGARLVGAAGFPDHHPYRREDIARLQRAARDDEALLVTTEKDFARLQPSKAFIDPALPAPMPIAAQVVFSEGARLDELTREALKRARAKKTG